jgi:hypothetical protein
MLPMLPDSPMGVKLYNSKVDVDIFDFPGTDDNPEKNSSILSALFSGRYVMYIELNKICGRKFNNPLDTSQ